MPLRPSELIEIRPARGKGRGVFARQAIPEGTVIERVPLLLVDWDAIDDSQLADYAYGWSEVHGAIALGYGSMYNHSFHPNARYIDSANRTKTFIAMREIAAGEEITVNYNGDPADRTNVLDFEVR